MPHHSPEPETGESPEQVEVRRRVLTYFFPSWCAARKTRDASALAPDWSFLTAELARWILVAIDQRIVVVRDGCATLPDGSRNALFENDKPRLFREGFVEMGAAGMLAGKFGWLPESLTFQSPPVSGTRRLWAFDLLAYGGEAETKRVEIAVEAKSTQRAALALAKSLAICGAGGNHSERDCSEPQNHHRKYQGLLDYRPKTLWIVSPDGLSGTPELLFRVKEAPGAFVQLEPAGPADLSGAG
jgi:hypothetical protein